jgi:hypothetical protein
MEVIGFLNLPSPSSRTMALELTQHLTKMSTRNLLWVVKSSWRVMLTTSPSSVSQLFRTSGIFDVLQTYRPSWPVTGTALLFTFPDTMHKRIMTVAALAY